MHNPKANFPQHILNKIDKQQWPHFTILETSEQTSKQAHQKALSFEQSFLDHYGRLAACDVGPEHPDILTIGKEYDHAQSHYKQEDLQEFFYFQERKPFSLKQQFIFIFDAARIPTALANKMLKLLEDTKSNCYIFLFNYQNTSILPTLYSRAVSFTLPQISQTDTSKKTKQLHWNPKLCAHEFLEEYRKQENAWWQLALRLMTRTQNDFFQHHLFIENYKNAMQSKKFHGPVHERAALLYQHLQNLSAQPSQIDL